MKTILTRANGLRLLVTLSVGAMATILVQTLRSLPREPGGITPQVMGKLDLSGVSHPVTAVLLNFRGYDTWLEIGVLVVAISASLCVQRRTDILWLAIPPAPRRVLTGLVQLLAPLMVLAGGYLLWLGKFAAGGAFQAGVVWGAALVLLWLSGRRGVAALPVTWWWGMVLLGFGLFLAVAAVGVLIGWGLLTFPPDVAGQVILILEVGAAVSIAVVAAALVITPHVASRPWMSSASRAMDRLGERNRGAD